MNLNARFPLRVLLFSLVLIFQFSCSKDSDLLTDYVLADSLDSKGIGNIVVDDTYQVSLSGSIVLDVLANDTFENEAGVVITETSTPTNGTVAINNDETLTYTSNTTEESVDTFTYTTEVVNPDGTVSTETGNVTVTVTTETGRNYGALKAFPAAYGSGSQATGGRGGSVIHVTNLNNSGSGSFRAAVEASGARTIVFDVSGTIELTSNLQVRNGNLTIAGQTAPIGGITLTGSNVYFNNVNNMILRYIRFRPNWEASGNVDAVNFSGCTNIIVDHCSISWSADEGISFVGSSGGVSTTGNITLQRSIIGESATGTIMGYSNYQSLGGNPTGNFSLLNNFYCNVSHRFPVVVTDDRADVINNFVHNWRYRLIVLNAPSNIKLNAINNYYQKGSIGSNALSATIVNRMDYDSNKSPIIYTRGNIINSDFVDTNADNSLLWDYWGAAKPPKASLDQVDSEYFVNSQYSILGDEAYPILTANEARVSVLADSGTNVVLDQDGNKIESIDVIDQKFLSDATTGHGVAYTYPGNWQNSSSYISFHNNVSSTPIATHPPSFDTDGDGMPNNWELSRNLDPNNKDDKDDLDGNGYTNLEEYINLVDF